ncbi:MAG TPA: aspartyl/asparaginyl beta-hydroxylase domain-containing protein [Pseudoxanthomonas sp.]
MQEQDRIAALMTEADQLSRSGRQDAAADRWRQVLDIEPDYPPALNFIGAYSMARGDLAQAREYLQRAVTAAPKFAMAHANLSRLYGAQGHGEAALAAITAAVHADPTAWGAHMERARLLEAKGLARDAATSWANALAYMPASAAQSTQLEGLVAQARKAVRDNQESLRGFLQDRMHGLMGQGDRPELERFQNCLDIVTGRREFVTARPLMLPYPRLPAIPFFNTADFDWVRDVEAAFPDILRELESVLERPELFVPYVQTHAGSPTGQFDALDRNLDWSALFLWKNGARMDSHADLCPRTEAAISRTPQNVVPNRAPVVFFSALRPGTHIPPHNGATNTRLTVHLPLIVPPDCGLRVGGETHVWHPGKVVVFDDTITHEAWNRSDQLRVVLIFDIWHPMLTPLERQLVAHTVESIMAFYGENADLGEL